MSAEPQGVKFGVDVKAAALPPEWTVRLLKAMDAVFPPGLEENLLEDKDHQAAD